MKEGNNEKLCKKMWPSLISPKVSILTISESSEGNIDNEIDEILKQFMKHNR